MIKLFASDLDGTLLNIRHESDEVIEEAVNKVIEASRHFTVATGRGLSMVDLKGLNDKVYYICLNGALIASNERKLLKYELIDKEILKELLDRFEDLNLEFIAPNKIYTRLSKEEIIENRRKPDPRMDKNVDWIKKFMSDVLTNFETSCSKEDILKQDICKINAHIDPAKDYRKLDEFLEQNKINLVNAPCDDGLYEITKIGVDKGAAVSWLAQYLGIQDDEVAVYGDGGNDLAMLERFEHSYSPSTGMSKALQVAKNVIGPYEEYSVVNHILDTLKD